MRRCGGAEWAQWLASHGIVALEEIDTRRLVLRIREAGAMRAAAVADEAELDPGAGARPDPAAAGDGGPGARLGRLLGRADRLQRGRPGAGGGRRLRRQGVDHAAAPAGRRGGDGVSARRRPRRPRRLRRRPALERPRRPGAARRGGRGDPRPARTHERARDLPRPPAPRARHRPLDLQAAVRPPWRQPPRARARDGARARHEPEPRLRRRAERRARGDLRLALRRHGRGLRLPGAERALGAVPSRGRARERTTRGRSSSAGSTGLEPA